MKIACFTPLSPLRTGVAEYSEKALLPYLANDFEIDLIVDKGCQASDPWIREKFSVRGYDDQALDLDDYDLLVYHIGNNPYHIYAYQTALKRPGLVILHDVFLHGLIWSMTIARNRVDDYIAELDYCQGMIGRSLAESAIRTGVYPEFMFPLVRRVVDHSIAVVVHSDYAMRAVLSECPDALIDKMQMPMCLQNLDPKKSTLRERYAIPADALIIASFGFVAPHKRLEICLQGFAELHAYVGNTVLVVFGDAISEQYLSSLREKAHSLGIQKAVLFAGHVDQLEDLTEPDIFVNLRYPTAGETSWSTLTVMGLAKPVIVSNVGWFSEIPDDCVLKINVTDEEIPMLVRRLKGLVREPSVRKLIGERAQTYVRRFHDPVRVGEGYSKLIRKAPSLVYIRPPIRALSDLRVSTDNVEVIKSLAGAFYELGMRMPRELESECS